MKSILIAYFIDSIKMNVAGAWIEHATQGFSVPRSTTELPGREVKFRKGLVIILEGPKGVKPAAFGRDFKNVL